MKYLLIILSLSRRNERNSEQKRGESSQIDHVRVHVSMQRVRQVDYSIGHQSSGLHLR